VRAHAHPTYAAHTCRTDLYVSCSHVTGLKARGTGEGEELKAGEAGEADEAGEAGEIEVKRRSQRKKRGAELVSTIEQLGASSARLFVYVRVVGA
jgi:hypothetical protein